MNAVREESGSSLREVNALGNSVGFGVTTLICPVSGTENSTDRTHCVQCGTDLRPLAHVSQLPQEYLTRGMALKENNKSGEALEQLAVAAALEPGSIQAHLALAGAYLAKGLSEMAWQHYYAASSLGPDDPDTGRFRRELEAAHSQSEAAALRESQRTTRLRRLMWTLPLIAFGAGLLTIGLSFRPSKSPPPPPAVRVRSRLQSLSATRDLKLSVTEHGGVLSVSGFVPDEVRLGLVRDIASEAVGDKADLSSLKTAPPELPVTYKVRRGDSLWLIARRKYGNGALWTDLAKANNARGSSPQMRVGDSLILPPLTIRPQ